MRVAATDPQGAVSKEITLMLEQVGDGVSGHYRGGSIVAGYLVDRFDETSNLRFCYAQTYVQGRLNAGTSTVRFEGLDGGRLRLIEAFQWLTRPASGTNLFEET
ncbi:MAG TPA: hypothetical protein VGR72_06225 [Candidatus Acidoferrales bacterium]|nr:hypothetical protein [Candidatus Acidoferrales bacterium]